MDFNEFEYRESWSRFAIPALNFGIMIHGGAGAGRLIRTSDRGPDIIKTLKASATSVFELLKRSQSSIDAVESAVVVMEDSGLFNTGVGSCLTVDRTIEMDAAIMDGNDLSAGSVGMVNDVKNPVKLARAIMEKTDHVMVVSNGAAELARLFNLNVNGYNKPTEERLEIYNQLYSELEQRWKKNYRLKHGTVGAVAIDKFGNVSAAVSTGGRWLKLPGRIGDSAIVGAGIYADNTSGAACATGDG